MLYQKIEVLVAGLEYPNDIALNGTSGKIYWTQWGSETGRILCANLDGTDVAVLAEVEDPKEYQLT